MSEQPESMSFFTHLGVLRKHLMRMVLFIGIGSIVAFTFKEIIFDTILLGPSKPEFLTNQLLCRLGEVLHSSFMCINQRPVSLINTTMTGQFTIHIMVSFIAGIVVAFPIIVFELWRFIRPALYLNERQKAGGMLFYSGILFFLGVLFGYFALAPISINFLINYQVSDQIANLVTISSYATLVASLSLACGLLFELPILTFILSQLGVLSPAFLRKYRRHSILIVFILSAIITPPDVFSQALVALPMMVLYEFSIFVSGIAVKQRKNYAKSHDA